MKRLGSALIAMVICSLLFVPNASAWWTETHEVITKNSVNLLSLDRKKSANFYEENESKLDFLYRGCVDPDFGDEAINGTHFYVCPDGKFENHGQYFKNACNCFMSQVFASVELSARTRFEEHYETALYLYKRKEKSSAFLELGRACHYLQDIACTPHSAGIRTRIIRKNVHEDYEKYVEYNLYNLNNAYTAYNVYGYVYGQKIGVVLNNLSIISSSYKNDLLSADEEKYREIANDTLPLAEQYTAAVLNKFACDVLYC